MRALMLLPALVVLSWVPASALAQFSGETPTEAQGTEIVDRSGERVPPGVSLRNERGEPVLFGDFLNLSRPVLVQFVYYDCPMLCSLVMNGYVSSARELNWTPGKDYEVVTVSFDPADTPEMAGRKKANYIESLEKEGAGEGWHFLTGEPEAVRELAESLGFGYRWVEEQGQFAHAAGMFVLTPDGTISRTLYGIEFPVQDLRLSLLEASEGRLGTPFDKLVLYCFQYDAETHKYAVVATNIMKLGALVTVILMGGFLLVQWGRERRRAKGSGHGGSVRELRRSQAVTRR